MAVRASIGAEASGDSFANSWLRVSILGLAGAVAGCLLAYAGIKLLVMSFRPKTPFRMRRSLD